MTHRTPTRVCRLVAFAALGALCALPAVTVTGNAWAGARPAGLSTVGAAPTVSDLAAVSLTSITPTIAVPKASVTISGTVRNAGSVPITGGALRAVMGARPLVGRADVAEWATTTAAGEPSGAEVARTSLVPTLAPGATTTFVLTVPATAIPHREPFAILPVRIDVTGTTSGSSQPADLGSLHTFLPTLSSVKEYEPISIAWLVPLTLDPDPALFGLDSPARTASWTTAVGPGSRLDRLITGTDSTKVTWAIDPAILGPPETPAAAGSSTPSPTASPTTGAPPVDPTTADPVAALTSTLAGRLRAAAPRHTFWSLPYADPDLTAVLPLGSGNRALQALISRTSTLDTAVGPARADVAWPVTGALTTQREQQLKAAYSAKGLAAVVTSASTLSQNSSHTSDASRKSSNGLPLLAYDDSLSRTFLQTSSAATGAIAIQRFLADSLALLGERPGAPGRSVLVATPRTFAGDPAVLSAFFLSIAKATWLTPTTADQLLEASKAVEPETGLGTTVPPTTPAPSPSATASPAAADPLAPGRSPLTAARLGTISRTLSAIIGIASIRDDAELFRTRWSDAQDQLLSVRWRGLPGGPDAIDAATSAAITSVSGGVRVVPSSVNFFADRGVLQITVVNDLAVPVHNVHLTLNPAQPRLRIEEQPGPLRIGAKSRTNVPLRVTAIAAGLVPISAVLTTPNGTPLGREARVDVRVQPTSTWIFWVLGAVAGIILVLGTYRSLRRGSTRAARPGVQEIPVDV